MTIDLAKMTLALKGRLYLMCPLPENTVLHHAPDPSADTLRLLDEIERLTDENERMRADRDQGARDYCDLMEHRDRQHVQIAKLEAALRPFVKYVHDDLRRGSATYELVAVDRHGGGLIGAEDLRRARAALAEGGPDDR